VKRDKWLFWDIGGVIMKVGYTEFCADLSRLFKTDNRKIIYFFEGENPPIWHEMEKGWVSLRIYEKISHHFKIYPPFDLFEIAFNSMCSGPVDELRFSRISGQLFEHGVKQGIISNINYMHTRAFEDKFERLLTHIPPEFRFYSCEHILRKPDKNFYKAVFKITGASPKNSFFVDDRAENVVAFPGTGFMFFNYTFLDYCLALNGLIP